MKFTEEQIELIGKVVMAQLGNFNQIPKMGVNAYYGHKLIRSKLKIELGNVGQIKKGQMVEYSMYVTPDKVWYEAKNEQGKDVDLLVAQKLENKLKQLIASFKSETPLYTEEDLISMMYKPVRPFIELAYLAGHYGSFEEGYEHLQVMEEEKLIELKESIDTDQMFYKVIPPTR